MHESIEAAQRDRKLNDNYSAIPENFSAQAKSLQRSLGYGLFQAEEPVEELSEDNGENFDPLESETPEEGLPEETPEEKKESLLNNPNYPLLLSLEHAGYVSSDEFQDIKTQILSGLGDNVFISVEKLINKNVTNGETKKGLLLQLNGKEEVTQDTFSSTEFFKDFSKFDTNNKPTGTSLELLLAENYSRIIDINGNNDIHYDLDVSMQISLNKILGLHDGDKDFKKKNSDYIKIIRGEGDVKDKMIALQKLFRSHGVDIGKGGEKQDKLFREKSHLSNQLIGEKKEYFIQQLNMLNEAMNNGDNKEIIKIKSDITKISDEWKTQGDVFSGNILDQLISEKDNGGPAESD